MLLTKINNFFTKYLLLFILASLIGGFYFSETLIPFSDYLPYFLMFMVFVLGTSCSLQSLTDVVRKPKGFIVGLIILYIFIPFIGFAIGKVFYSSSPEYALGHFLLAVTPVAITSMIWTGFIGGNLVLSLALIFVVTIFSGFMIPLQISLFMGEVVEFDAIAMMLNLFKMIVLPVIAGIFMRYKAPAMVEKVSPGANLLNKIIMMIILSVNGAAVNPYIDSIDWHIIRMFLIVGLHLVLNYSVAFVLCWLTLGKDSKDLPSIIFTSGMRNNAAGVVIALQYFGAEVALPVIICIFLQQLSAGGVFSLLQKKFHHQVTSS
ncbi:bile acid:sodium symporter family protein [Oceanispirochaeta crateris]|uniref:Bile acid:sodium symporter family protein n=1 Tax=Oceanispirochaeta crateris TaxID=2518645 RepID=A0A5C1QKM6_9SPIO|nr:bile acid:sodium symporter family protein [Oceanispirochaeta crateris]QEN08151.1 bile acid:sodium symporter family protein [Oceanispirochaeta crateris]